MVILNTKREYVKSGSFIEMEDTGPSDNMISPDRVDQNCIYIRGYYSFRQCLPVFPVSGRTLIRELINLFTLFHQQRVLSSQPGFYFRITNRLFLAGALKPPSLKNNPFD